MSHGNEPLKLRMYLFFLLPLFLLRIWHGLRESGRLFGNDLGGLGGGDRTTPITACSLIIMAFIFYQSYLEAELSVLNASSVSRR